MLLRYPSRNGSEARVRLTPTRCGRNAKRERPQPTLHGAIALKGACAGPPTRHGSTPLGRPRPATRANIRFLSYKERRGHGVPSTQQDSCCLLGRIRGHQSAVPVSAGSVCPIRANARRFGRYVPSIAAELVYEETRAHLDKRMGEVGLAGMFAGSS